MRGHFQTLQSGNYTVRKQIDITTENGTTLVNYTHVSNVGTNRTRAVDVQTYDDRRVDWWFNGTRLATRTQQPNGTEYSGDDSQAYDGVTGLLGGDVLRQTLEDAETPTVTTAEDGVRIRITTPPEDAVGGYRIVGGLHITARTVTITMTEDGRITRYTAEFTGYPANNPETTVEGSWELRYTAFGETTVERPSWVEDARNASTEPVSS